MRRLSQLLELAVSQRDSALNERDEAHAEVRPSEPTFGVGSV